MNLNPFRKSAPQDLQPPAGAVNRAERRRQARILDKAMTIEGVVIADELKNTVELFYAQVKGKRVVIGVRKKR